MCCMTSEMRECYVVENIEGSILRKGGRAIKDKGCMQT